MTKSRIFLFVLLAFVGGILVRSFFVLPVIFIWLAVSGATAVLAIGIMSRSKSPVVYGLLVLSALAGVIRFDQVERSLPDVSSFYNLPLTIRGYLSEEPEVSKNVSRLRMRVQKIEGKAVEQKLQILVTTRRYPRYSLGDELEIQGLLGRPQNFSEFDYVSYLAKENIAATVSFPLIEKIGEGKGNKLRIWLSRAKHSFEDNIDQVLAEPHAAFLKGLTLGERESLPPDLVENFNRTGTTHIVALSGYNITLVSRFFMSTLLFLTVPFYTSFWMAASAIVLFVILVGASPSVIRAGIMGILVLVAEREGRIYNIRNALALAAAAMIFHNPHILRFDAAFQLSFLATLGLVYLAPPVERFLDRISSKLSLVRTRISPGRDVKKQYTLFPFKRTLIETLSAQLMVLPLLIYLFGRVSMVSPLSNVLVLMAVPYAMVVGFITGFLGFLWTPLAEFAGAITWVLLEYQIRLIEFFASFSVSLVEVGRWVLVPVLIFYSVMLFWVFTRRFGKFR